tara:strand:+ start:1587 stop:2147 length:561 start_codon:yes stop_codon:yes gene_type:complete
MQAQKKPIKIKDELVKNRLNLYAINENLIDYDITVIVKGTGFKQRAGKPRLTRIPATSRIKISSLVVERNKEPKYTYLVVANDSLSRRSLRPEFTAVKVDPPIPVFLYVSDRCVGCDSLVSSLNSSVFNYEKINLSTELEKASKLEKYLPGMDTIKKPILNIGGYLYTNITTMDQLLEKLLAKESK